MTSASRRILVVGPSWVGDMVMAQSLFITLREREPQARIDVLAPAWSLPLLARMPEVERGIAMPLGHGEFGWGVRRTLGHSLRDAGYARAIVLPGSLKSALVPWFASIPQRTGFRGEMRYGLINDMRPLNKTQLPMTVQRFVSLGQPERQASEAAPNVPRPRLQTSPANLQRLLDVLQIDAARPAVAMMPGAEYGPAKQWPLAHFAALASDCVARGEQVWVLGSAKDAPAGEQIVRAAGPGVHNLCGRTELADAVDLIGAARAAVTNDSGLMHVAAAVGTPVVAIYGSSTPHHTPPLSDRATVLYLGLPCSPCFKRECPFGHTRCLQDIAPSQVGDALAAARA